MSRICLPCRRCRSHGFNPWVGKIPRGGNGNPLQYSCWASPMDSGDSQAMVHWVTKSQTQLKHLSAHGLYITWIIHACMCNIVVKNARVNYNGHQPFCFQPPLCLLNTPGYQLDLPPKASRVQSAYRPLPMRVHMRGTARCLIL